MDVCGAFIFERLDTGAFVLKEKPVEAPVMESSIDIVSSPSCGAGMVYVMGNDGTVPDVVIKHPISATPPVLESTPNNV